MNTNNKNKPIKILHCLPVLFFAFILSFCSGGSGSADSRDMVLAEESFPVSMETANLDKTEQGDVEIPIYERKLTKNGSIQFQTSDLNKTKQFIIHAVNTLNGYIANDNLSESDKRVANTITARIPAEKTDSLIRLIESNASKIDFKNIDVEDVTEQFIDLESRIKTKKEVETRYRELLAKANTVEEILKIEEQIGNIRTEIESAEGRLRYLSNQVRYSTLTVTFYEQSAGFGFREKISKAFKNGWNNLLWMIVGLTNLWVVFLLIAIVLSLVVFFTKRKNKREQPPAFNKNENK